MEKKSTYDIQAEDFMKETGTEITIEFKEHGFHFTGDTEKRDIYNVTIKKGRRHMKIVFGNSLVDSGFKIINENNGKTMCMINVPDKQRDFFMEHKNQSKLKLFSNWQFISSEKIHYPKAPTPYSILACLQKYDVGTFEQFCQEFGYDTDSRKAEQTYNAVQDEWRNVAMLYNDKELEMLQEIS